MLDPSECARTNQFDRSDHFRAQALLKVHRQNAPSVSGGLDHCVRLASVNRHRFFDQHVTARAQTVNRHRRVERVGRKDHHHVGSRLPQHRFVIGERRATEFVSAFSAHRLVNIGDAYDLGVFTRERRVVHRVNLRPHADDRVAKFLGRAHVDTGDAASSSLINFRL